MPKAILWVAVALNLAAGNTILYLMLNKDSLLVQASFHTVASAVALLMLVLLFRKARNAKTPMMIALSLSGALMVPTVATFIVTAGIGIHHSTPDAVAKAGFLAVIAGVSSCHLWVPFGTVNALLL